MSEFKFACPTCGQHIAGDERWAGAQIKCPACQSDMIVPKLEEPAAPTPPPPAPVPVQAPTPVQVQASPSPVRLSLSPAPAARPSHPAAAPAPAAPAAPAPFPPPRPPMSHLHRPEPKSGKARTLVTVAIIAVVMAGVVVLVLPMINRAQDKLDAARKKDAEEAGGGQVGHVMELNKMLDATDPERFSRSAGMETKKLPPLPTWSLDVAAATFPSTPVCGKVVGAPIGSFDSSIDVNGQAYLLSFKQKLPPREVLVSLRLKPGEGLQGRSWVIAKETPGAPGIVRKWQNDTVSDMKQSVIPGGYAMKLEFGKASAGLIEGKIYLALPDTEQTVLAGQFFADIRVAGQARNKSGRPGMPAFDE